MMQQHECNVCSITATVVASLVLYYGATQSDCGNQHSMVRAYCTSAAAATVAAALMQQLAAMTADASTVCSMSHSMCGTPWQQAAALCFMQAANGIVADQCVLLRYTSNSCESPSSSAGMHRWLHTRLRGAALLNGPPSIQQVQPAICNTCAAGLFFLRGKV
jgi:hypothetical protein